MWKKSNKDNNGFTGLEAAIVLVAFVVVAAVFSYVMLGAGFYTTQKSQEVVHTGVEQASSSVELSGDVIAIGDTTTNPDEIDSVNLFLQLTSGGSAVDISKTLMVYSDPNTPATDLLYGVGFTVPEMFNDNADNLLEKGEKFRVNVDLSAYDVAANDEFQLEIKPPQGATYIIHRTAPASISAIMTLV